MSGKPRRKIGLFQVCYEIGKKMPGAPLLRLNLAVYTPEETVSGIGHITQATRPPLNIGVSLHGHYTYMCVMPRNCHILVTATGYPVNRWPLHGGVGPVLPASFDMKMILTEDWKSGTANFKYMDGRGKWHEIKDVPVKQVPCNTI